MKRLVLAGSVGLALACASVSGLATGGPRGVGAGSGLQEGDQETKKNR